MIDYSSLQFLKSHHLDYRNTASSSGPGAVALVTLVPGADALDRLTRNLTVELEELVSYRRQDLDLTETT